MKETTMKIQIVILVLILVISVASFVFGPGTSKNTNLIGQSSPPVTPGAMLAPPETNLQSDTMNAAERDLIVGLWVMDPNRNNPGVQENWTFYEDGTVSEVHNTSASFDHGTWKYLGDDGYLVTLDGKQMNILRNGNSLENFEDKSTFHRAG